MVNNMYSLYIIVPTNDKKIENIIQLYLSKYTIVLIHYYLHVKSRNFIYYSYVILLQHLQIYI